MTLAINRSLVVAGREASGPLRVAHVADFCRRYPGEPVRLLTKVTALADAPAFSLRISLPRDFKLSGSDSSSPVGDESQLLVVGNDQYLLWRLPRGARAGEAFEFEARGEVGHVRADKVLESEATVTGDGDADTWSASETLAIEVRIKGAYLRFLPGIYGEDDDLMARYVMIFESFWAPIEQQIESSELYYDPEFTPTALLPWLATWVDLTLDERWPEAKRRQLLSSAVALYRKRGTRLGLQEYLAIYTGARVRITEHGADNFRLGPTARLGPGVALGTLNKPHTFTVTAFLPRDEDEAAGALTPEERERRDAARRRMIETIIEAEKPAHTSYTLRLETR